VSIFEIKEKETARGEVLNQYWVLTAYTVTDQDHDDGYLRQTKNESWV